jgi:hypothetical protein
VQPRSDARPQLHGARRRIGTGRIAANKTKTRATETTATKTSETKAVTKEQYEFTLKNDTGCAGSASPIIAAIITAASYRNLLVAAPSYLAQHVALVKSGLDHPSST